LVGYRFTKEFSAGPGLVYQYWKFQTFKYHIYGAKVFARYVPVDFLILQTEYERLTLAQGIISPNDRSNTDKTIFNGWFVGGGYRHKVSSRTALSFMVMYNVLDGINSPYDSNPILRGGISVGL